MDLRIQFVNCQVVASGREYHFRVTGQDQPERLFVFTIGAADFAPGRLKFQEGPEVSFHKVQDMLAIEETDSPLRLQQRITPSDVTHYLDARSSKVRKWTEEERLKARQRLRERRQIGH